MPGTSSEDVQGEDPAFVCAVSQAIRAWFAEYAPARTLEGALTFGLATTSGSTVPLVRVSGLTLRLADISDLF